MDNSYINISKLTLDELIGVVNLYPWYAVARKELCKRMLEVAGDSWGNKQCADTALYCTSRKKVYNLLRESKEEKVYKDEDIEKILSEYIESYEKKAEQKESKTPKVHVVGGDYFTQEAYENIQNEESPIFTKAMLHKAKEENQLGEQDINVDDFCTETLAQIYLEQGYYDRAKAIYSKLILLYPEKNTYFASLIDKINQEY